MACGSCGGRRTPVPGQTIDGYEFIPPTRLNDAGETIQPETIGPLSNIIEARAIQRQYGGGRIKTLKK